MKWTKHAKPGQSLAAHRRFPQAAPFSASGENVSPSCIQNTGRSRLIRTNNEWKSFNSGDLEQSLQNVTAGFEVWFWEYLGQWPISIQAHSDRPHPHWTRRKKRSKLGHAAPCCNNSSVTLRVLSNTWRNKHQNVPGSICSHHRRVLFPVWMGP